MITLPKEFDLSGNPTFPGPWLVSTAPEGEALVDSQGKYIRAPGAVVAGFGLISRSATAATARAKKIRSRGYRVVISHHSDNLLLDENSSSISFEAAHVDGVNRFFRALAKQSIPIIHDLVTQSLSKDDLLRGVIKTWDSLLRYLDLFFSKIDHSNIVALCPVNEDTSGGFISEAAYGEYLDRLYREIRARGYKGLLYGNNAGYWDPIKTWSGSIPGDLEAWHVYVGEENQPPNVVKDLLYSAQKWNWVVPKTRKPRIATEIGALWPAPRRGICEREIIDVLLAQDFQVIAPFSLLDMEEDWDSSYRPASKFKYCDDPTRLETVRYLVHAMAGKPYLAEAYNPNFAARRLDEFDILIENQGV